MKDFLMMCSGCWLTYSIMVNDMWVFIPNVFGVILGVAQLVIYAVYCGSDKSKVADSDRSARDVLVNNDTPQDVPATISEAPQPQDAHATA